MADTKNNILLTEDDWQDVNTLTSIGVGVSLSIENQTRDVVYGYIGSTKPNTLPSGHTNSPATDTEGFQLIPPRPEISIRIVDSGQSRVWVFGSGPINVQEL